jgi:sulfite reductase beta subunit-like hemoprotein
MNEIEEFRLKAIDFAEGRLEETAFQHFRLKHGVYGQRQPNVQMVRVKVPAGGLTPAQLHRLADTAERFGNGIGHITTRQDLQFHFVQLLRVHEVMERLAQVGLTTREACGNTVRNVTACALTGIHGPDVTAPALAVSRHFLRHAACQNLPRKFKISFGCTETCAGAGFHDIGAVPAAGGFRLWIAGGLGNTPRAAQLLEPLTPQDDLIRTCEAILRVFDAYGNRKNRNRARLKFVVDLIGWEGLRDAILKAREPLPRTAIEPTTPETAPVVLKFDDAPPHEREYAEWLRTNVVPHGDFVAAQVTVPLGDLTTAQMHGLAKIGAIWADGRIRTTVAQNILFRWVHKRNVGAVWRRLRELELAERGAGRVADITSCPGADTCRLAFTASRGLARALKARLDGVPEELSIKISGCPNACGQHHVADVGFFGVAARSGDAELPSYTMLVGGSATRFAIPIGRVPARQAPAAFRAVTDLYVRERRPDEAFGEFVRRVGKDALAEAIPAGEPGPDDFRDWGRDEQFVSPGRVTAECAAPGL